MQKSYTLKQAIEIIQGESDSLKNTNKEFANIKHELTTKELNDMKHIELKTVISILKRVDRLN
ncbi:MAG: hypothetical protein V4509_00485 [Patescibacteria group bacterium]